MNSWLRLFICLMAACFIGSYTIIVYSFTHFESTVVGMITMLFVYVLLRLNKIERMLDALVALSESGGKDE